MLKLNNGFFVESDENQYILKQSYIGKDKDGKPKEQARTLGYYAELKQALNGYINQLALNKTCAEDLTTQELLDYLKQERDLI